MLVYMGLSALVAPRFPFAIVDMYARMGPRYDAQVPRMMVDGHEVDPDTLVDFQGFDPAQFDAAGRPSSRGWDLARMRNRVAQHAAAPGAAPGDVEVAFGWQHLSIDEAGTILDGGFEVIARGTARRK